MSAIMPLSIHKVEVPMPNLGVSVLVRPNNQSDANQWVLAWSPSELNGSYEHTENLLYFNELDYHSGKFTTVHGGRRSRGSIIPFHKVSMSVSYILDIDNVSPFNRHRIL